MKIKNPIQTSIRHTGRALFAFACVFAFAASSPCAEGTNPAPEAPAITNPTQPAPAPENTPPPAGSHKSQTPGDLVLMGQSAVIGEDENVLGSAVVVGGGLTIYGKVNGDAVCVGGKFKVGPKAQIGGDMVTVGSVSDVDPAAKIGGSKVNVASFPVDLMKRLSPMAETHDKAHPDTKAHLREMKHKAVLFFMLEVAFFALLLFVALLMTTFMPVHYANITEHLQRDFGRSALLGFAVMIVSPVALLILVITITGLPLVPLVLLAILLGQLVGYVALGCALGRHWLGSKGPMIQTIAGLIVLQAAAILGDMVGLTSGPRSPLALLLGALGMLIFIVGSFTGLGAVISSRLGRRTLVQTAVSRGVGVPPVQS